MPQCIFHAVMFLVAVSTAFVCCALSCSGLITAFRRCDVSCSSLNRFSLVGAFFESLFHAVYFHTLEKRLQFCGAVATA